MGIVTISKSGISRDFSFLKRRSNSKFYLVWGAVLMTTPACYNFAGIAANRFILGLTEAVVNPGFVLIMSIWYTAPEQPLRLEAYYCTNGIATMFGGLVSSFPSYFCCLVNLTSPSLIGYAVGHITTGLARWMYVFIIFGSVSVSVGIATLIILPDLPATTKFLTERERAIAVERVSSNRQGIKNRHFKMYQAVQAAKDPKTWLLFIMAVGAQVPNSALTSVRTYTFPTRGNFFNLTIPIY